MTKTIYIDLDGTILDVWDRYYSIFSDFLKYKSIDASNIDINKYINNKIANKKDLDLINNNFLYDEYKKYRDSRLENEIHLLKDKIIGNPTQCFKNRNFNLILLTIRNNRQSALNQLTKLEISNLFDEIIILENSSDAKYLFLKENIKSNDIVIGDGMQEIEAANKLGIVSYCVRTGFASIMLQNNATYIANNYMEAIENIR